MEGGTVQYANFNDVSCSSPPYQPRRRIAGHWPARGPGVTRVGHGRGRQKIDAAEQRHLIGSRVTPRGLSFPSSSFLHRPSPARACAFGLGLGLRCAMCGVICALQGRQLSWTRQARCLFLPASIVLVTQHYAGASWSLSFSLSPEGEHQSGPKDKHEILRAVHTRQVPNQYLPTSSCNARRRVVPVLSCRRKLVA